MRTGPGAALHQRPEELHWYETREVDGQLVVLVRLFSRLGAPPYQVVAGPLR